MKSIFPYVELFAEMSAYPESGQSLRPNHIGPEFPLQDGQPFDTTPPIPVGEGRWFYLIRLRGTDLPEVTKYIERTGGIIAGSTFEEVWRNYKSRSKVFKSLVEYADFEGAKGLTSKSLYEIRSAGLKPHENIATPIYTFEIDVPSFPLDDFEGVKDTITARAIDFKKEINADNVLTYVEKANITAYLDAVIALDEASNVDDDAKKFILGRLRKYLGQLSLKLGEKMVVDQLLDWITSLIG